MKIAVSKHSIQSRIYAIDTDTDLFYAEYEFRKLSNQAYVLETSVAPTTALKDATDSDEEEDLITFDHLYMSNLNYKYESSIYSSSDDDAESDRQSPVPDDANSELH